jgi:hypothetical protein
MIYLMLLFSFDLKALDSKDIKKYSPEERKKITIELIRQKNYALALSFSPDQNLTGCIKILKDNLTEGIEDIKESAEKGNLFSCDLYLLFNLQVGGKDLKNYIKKELDVSEDSTFSFDSPYVRYLAFHPESLYVWNIPSDSVLYPYIIFKSGMIDIEKDPEKTKYYFEILVDNYPNSIPAAIARNTLNALEKKTETQKK